MSRPVDRSNQLLRLKDFTVTARRRAELRKLGRIYELRVDGESCFLRITEEREGWPVVDDVTPKAKEALVQSLQASRRQTERSKREREFYLRGDQPQAPAKNRGRRVKGSRGRRIEDGDYEQASVDLMDQWLRKGTITRRMYQAACRFRNDLRSMNTPGLSAAPLVKVRVDVSLRVPSGPPDWPATSRADLQKALVKLGGPDSAMASAIYHIVGLEMAIREWCRIDGRVKDDRAVPGLLFAALELLARHYGIPRP